MFIPFKRPNEDAHFLHPQHSSLPYAVLGGSIPPAFQFWSPNEALLCFQETYWEEAGAFLIIVTYKPQ